MEEAENSCRPDAGCKLAMPSNPTVNRVPMLANMSKLADFCVATTQYACCPSGSCTRMAGVPPGSPSEVVVPTYPMLGNRSGFTTLTSVLNPVSLYRKENMLLTLEVGGSQYDAPAYKLDEVVLSDWLLHV